MCGVTQLDKIIYERKRRTTKVGEESQGKELEVVWTLDQKRRALRGKESDVDGSTRQKEEMKMVGQSSELCYQREGTVG